MKEQKIGYSVSNNFTIEKQKSLQWNLKHFEVWFE